MSIVKAMGVMAAVTLALAGVGGALILIGAPESVIGAAVGVGTSATFWWLLGRTKDE